MSRIDQRDRRAGPCFRLIQSLLEERISGRQSRVHRDLAYTEVIILQDLESTLRLYGMMLCIGPPADQRLLIFPVGKRKNPSLPSETAITDVVDEPLDFLQHRPQSFRVVEVGVPLLCLGPHFKED